jgi:hypothetical protein
MRSLRWLLGLGSTVALIASATPAGHAGADSAPRTRGPVAPWGGQMPPSDATVPAAPIAEGGPTNVNVSRDPNNESEATIAVNPLNPNNLIVVSNIEEGGGLFKAFSMNGGQTWQKEIIADGDNLGTACCDPKGEFDLFGNYFLTYLNSAVTMAQVALSTNGGQTFRYLGAAHTGAVDFPGLSTGPGVVWVMWSGGSLVQARGFEVLGLGQFGQAGPVQSLPGSGGGAFGDVAIGPNGQAMVVYQDNFPPFEGPSDIHVNIDPDGLGPRGFTQARTVTTTNVGSFDSIPAMDSRTVLASVNLEWDRTGGPNHGRLYLVYNDEFPNESDNTEVVLRYTDDNGLTWSGRVRVNDDRTRRSQFLPWASLDRTTGSLAVSFHDARNDGGDLADGDTNGIPNDDAQYWAAVSVDGGLTFLPNIRLSAGTSNEDQAMNGIDYGDYTGVSFHAQAFHGVWADNSNSTGDNPDGTLNEFDLYTARVGVG